MARRNRQRARLALAELEKEMELLTEEQMNACKGGNNGSTGVYFPSMDNPSGNTLGSPECDCFFQCLGYASNKYGYNQSSTYYESQYYGATGNNCGIDREDADEFASRYFSRTYLNEKVPGVLENFVKNQSNTLIASFNTYADGSTGVQVQHSVIVLKIEEGIVVYFDLQQKKLHSIPKEDVTSFIGLTGRCD